jgi:hypothetical protein
VADGKTGVQSVLLKVCAGIGFGQGMVGGGDRRFGDEKNVRAAGRRPAIQQARRPALQPTDLSIPAMHCSTSILPAGDRDRRARDYCGRTCSNADVPRHRESSDHMTPAAKMAYRHASESYWRALP